MLQNRRKIAQKVKQLITKNGIPVYLDKWNAELLADKPFDNPRYTDKQFYADLTHYVKQYHYHSSLNYKLVDGESNSDTPAEQHITIQNHKRQPEMTWDNTNKIGTIKYYEYYLDLDDQFANDPVFQQLTTMVQTKLSEWQHQGMRGLIIDLRDSADVYKIRLDCEKLTKYGLDISTFGLNKYCRTEPKYVTGFTTYDFINIPFNSFEYLSLIHI